MTGMAWAQDATKVSLLKEAKEFYLKGKYESAISSLESTEVRLLNFPGKVGEDLGLIYYWKGLTFKKLSKFSDSITSLNLSQTHGFNPEDLDYELAQAYYANEKMTEALEHFAISYKRGFKRSVSLYYLGFISKELGRNDDAITFLNSIKKINDDDVKDVKQPSSALLGDIYTAQIKANSDEKDYVANKVIPQYEYALRLDDDSELAPLINEKINKLLQDHKLALFKLRNGRPALRPQYFAKVSQGFGVDSNVTFSPANTTISSSKQSSAYSKTDVFGKYTFYAKDFFSIAPEFRFNNMYYFHRVPQIYRNDNFLVSGAVRTAYEHSLLSKPAALLLDFEHFESRRDVNATKHYDFSSRTDGAVVGENFQFFARGETTFKFRHRQLTSYLANSNSKTTSFVLEQFLKFEKVFIVFYVSYDRTRVVTSAFDTNSITGRGDFIFPELFKLFSPSAGLALTSTDPINNRIGRGTEILINPSVTLSRSFAKRWKTNLRYDYQNNHSRDKNSFAYKKQIYSLDLEYLF